MTVITLTTESSSDFHAAILKGILFSGIPSVQVVDISRQSYKYNTSVLYAAYMVKQSYHFFPKGSIHIISIASEYKESAPFAAAFHNGHYFIGSDNGIFGMLFDTEPDEIIRIEKYNDDTSPNYPAISVFAPAAIHIANGGYINELGPNYSDYQNKRIALATLEESKITGSVIHINTFGNVITNVTFDDFERISKGRPFEIMIQSIRNKITRINRYFNETSDGEILAVFNIAGHLEIAQYKGNISEMLHLQIGSNIIIKFYDKS